MSSAKPSPLASVWTGMRWILLALLVTTGASRMQVLAAVERAGAGTAPARQQVLIEAAIIEVALGDAKVSALDELRLPADAVSHYPSARGAIDTPGMLLLAPADFQRADERSGRPTRRIPLPGQTWR